MKSDLPTSTSERLVALDSTTLSLLAISEEKL